MKSSNEFRSIPRSATPATVTFCTAPQYFSRGLLSVTSTIAPFEKGALASIAGVAVMGPGSGMHLADCLKKQRLRLEVDFAVPFGSHCRMPRPAVTIETPT